MASHSPNHPGSGHALMNLSPSSDKGHVCPLSHTTQSLLPSPLPTHHKSPYSGLIPFYQDSSSISSFPIIQVRRWYFSRTGQLCCPSLLLALFGPLGAMGRGVTPSSPPHRSLSLLVQLCRILLALQCLQKTPVNSALSLHFLIFHTCPESASSHPG